jgi:hypothetical protein
MPRARILLRALLFAASALGASACADLPTAPTPDGLAPSNGLVGNLLGTLAPAPSGEVSVLERTTPLTEDEVVTQWVGRLGGVIRLPRSGLTVVVPFGALSRSTRITVTAPAGDLVGYDFQPHGLQFERPLMLTQDLLSTEGLGLLNLQAVYFEGELEASVAPLETLPVWVFNALGIYRVEHFSGYALARRGYVVATD